jgi:hypothetical protein
MKTYTYIYIYIHIYIYIYIFMDNISVNSSYNEKYFTQNQHRKLKHEFYVQQLSFQKSCRLLDNVEKYCRAVQATDANTIRRMRFARWITKSIHTQNM